jgi:hypothetical protein
MPSAIRVTAAGTITLLVTLCGALDGRDIDRPMIPPWPP